MAQGTDVLRSEEFLFAPYSVFTVVDASWNAGTDDDPHIVRLDAATVAPPPSADWRHGGQLGAVCGGFR